MLKTKDMGRFLHVILLSISILAFVGYVVVMFIAYVYNPAWLESLRSAAMGEERFAIGVPVSAAAAYVVVALLLHIFPPEKRDDSITFKVFGMEFTGPAGPVILWGVVFLSLIVATYVLSE